MKNLLTLDECVNEAASQFKHAVQQALQAAGYNLKQSEVKIGAKKVRGMGTKITLNGEMIGFDDEIPKMIASFTKSIQEDPEKYGLKESLNEGSDYDKYALKMYGKKWDDLDRDKQSEVVDAVEGNYPLSKIKRVKESVNEAGVDISLGIGVMDKVKELYKNKDIQGLKDFRQRFDYPKASMKVKKLVPKLISDLENKESVNEDWSSFIDRNELANQKAEKLKTVMEDDELPFSDSDAKAIAKALGKPISKLKVVFGTSEDDGYSKEYEAARKIHFAGQKDGPVDLPHKGLKDISITINKKAGTVQFDRSWLDGRDVSGFVYESEEFDMDESLNEADQMHGEYLMQMLKAQAEDLKKQGEPKTAAAMMYLWDRINQSARDEDIDAEELHNYLNEPRGRKHSQNLPEWMILDLFVESYLMKEELEELNESLIGIKTDKSFKPADLQKALDKAKVKYKMNRLSMTLTVLNLEKEYFEAAQQVVNDLGLGIMMAKESVNEGSILVWDEVEDDFDTLMNKLDDIGSQTTDPKWNKAILSIYNQLDKVSHNLSQYDRKLGAITTESVKFQNIQTFNESVNETVKVEVERYKRSHNKNPNGFGSWAFSYNRQGIGHFFTPMPMSYKEAVKWAKGEAKRDGEGYIYVMESLNEELDRATTIYQVATPAPQGMLVKELEKIFPNKTIVTEVGDADGYESVIIFDLSGKDLKLIRDNIGDVLVWKYPIGKKKGVITGPNESVNERKVPPNDETIKFHIDSYKVDDDPYDVAKEIGSQYNWTEREIEKAEKIIRKKYLR